MKNFVLVIMLLVCLRATSQLPASSSPVAELISKTVDDHNLMSMRELIFLDLPSLTEEKVTKSYDSICQVFYQRFQTYYKTSYTPHEIDQLLKFYRVAPGAKLGPELAKLYLGELPEDNSFWKRRAKVKKDVMEGVIQPRELQPYRKNGNFSLLKKAIGFKYFISEVKADAILSIQPEYEAAFIKEFDSIAIQYEQDIEQYYLTNYTAGELNQILSFYKTSVGRKVAKNASKFIKVTMETNHEWLTNLHELLLLNHERE